MSKTIVGLGEVLLDLFPDYKKPGGAPCNVVYNATQLGNRGVLVSAVGNDDASLTLLDFMNLNDIQTQYIQRSEKPSGTVRVSFRGDEASYNITQNVAWDDIKWNDSLAGLAKDADAVCFSTLSQRSEPSASTIIQFLETVPETCLKVLDVNLRPPYFSPEVISSSCRLANVVKVNEHEYVEIEKLLGLENLISFLLDKCSVELLIVTLGKKGSRCVTRKSDTTYPTQVADSSNGDSVGVGDAFIACVIHHLLKGTPEAEMMKKANRFAGIVASKQGAMISFQNSLLDEVR